MILLFIPKGGVSFRAQRGGEMQRESAAAQCTPRFLSVERKRAVPVQKKGVYIASEQLEELQCLPIALPIARRCRVSIAI